MGSFNVACGISRIHIRPDDPVMMFVLAKNTFTRMESSSIYPTDTWVVVGVPIPGKYYDYGMMVVTGGMEYEYTFTIAQTHSEIKLISPDLDTFYKNVREQSTAPIALREMTYMYMHQAVYDKLTTNWQRTATLAHKKRTAYNQLPDYEQQRNVSVYEFKDVLFWIFDWQHTINPHAIEVVDDKYSDAVLNRLAQLNTLLWNMDALDFEFTKLMTSGQVPVYSFHREFYAFASSFADTLERQYKKEYDDE